MDAREQNSFVTGTKIIGEVRQFPVPPGICLSINRPVVCGNPSHGPLLLAYRLSGHTLRDGVFPGVYRVNVVVNRGMLWPLMLRQGDLPGHQAGVLRILNQGFDVIKTRIRPGVRPRCLAPLRGALMHDVDGQMGYDRGRKNSSPTSSPQSLYQDRHGSRTEFLLVRFGQAADFHHVLPVSPGFALG